VGALTASGLRGLRGPGQYRDGQGLYLQVEPSGRRSWVFRFMLRGRARTMSFGNADLVTLAEARRAHTEARALLARGIDPLDERHKATKPRHTFSEAAEHYIAGNKAGWRGPRTERNWRASLALHAYPVLGNKPVGAITTEDVLAVLSPVWTTTPPQAGLVRNRIELVLDYAKARGWRDGENPARWRGNLGALLPAKARVHTETHRPALPWQEAPAFMAELAALDGMAPRCLEFLVLTAARSGEARGARWEEIDLDQALWTIPGSRMKTGKPHRVPLSGPALAILAELRAIASGDLVFTSRRGGRPIGSSTLLNLLHALGWADITVHGFRSCFRDWVADNGHSADAAEAALAHAAGSRVERAYARSDLLDMRRGLMAAWGGYLTSPQAAVPAVYVRAA
jgi:integrase